MREKRGREKVVFSYDERKGVIREGGERKIRFSYYGKC